MASENQTKLRRLLAKSDEIAAQVRLDVPSTTLRRHVRSKEAPHPSWIAYYLDAFGWPFQGWLVDGYKKRVKKATKALRRAITVNSKQSVRRAFGLSAIPEAELAKELERDGIFGGSL